jgi:hypothetical protein
MIAIGSDVYPETNILGYFENIEGLENKKFNVENQNTWKHESGSSISELIKLAKIEFYESVFEKILNKILNKYETA